MSRWVFYASIALLTCATGLASAFLWRHHEAQRQLSNLSARNEIGSEIDRGLLDPKWVYIGRDVQWETLPNEYGVPGPCLHADGHIVIFFPSGSYAEIFCSLLRRKDGPARAELVYNADFGFIAYLGNWTRNSDGTISSNATFSSIGLYNREGPHTSAYNRRWMVRQPATDQIGSILEADGRLYVSASEIEGLDQIRGMVQGSKKRPKL